MQVSECGCSQVIKSRLQCVFRLALDLRIKTLCSSGLKKAPQVKMLLLNKYGYNSEENILIIDGQCLETALNNHEKLFFDVTLKVF